MSAVNGKSLAELQTALQDFLLDKRVNTDELTLETPAFARHERLAIYHNAYRLRLIDALGNDYPVLKFYVGEEGFAELAREFIAHHPSKNPSLRWLGEQLAAFLRKHVNWQEKTHLIELVEFEWAQITAFDAEDTSLITLDKLRLLPPEHWMTLQLQFHPSLQLLHFYSNAPERWHSAINDEVAFETKTNAELQAWLIWRDDLQVLYRALEEPEAWALQAFLTSHNFADVCEGLCEWFDEEKVPLQTAQYLQQWISGNLITKIFTAEREL